MAHELIHEETIYRGRIFNLVRARIRLSNNAEHTYDLVRHHGAVVIVPVDTKGRIWFVSQYRVGAEQTLMELPAGLLEEGETPEASAAREVQEEIGMAAGEMRSLGEFYMVPGYSTEKMVVFLATGLYDSSLPKDEDEILESAAIPVDEVYRMARAGKFRDGKTLAALLLAEPHLAGFLRER